jgi:hypothetical protein
MDEGELMRQQNCISENKLRISNLKQFIKDKYKGNKRKFYADLEKKMKEQKGKVSNLGKIKQLQDAMREDTKRNFTKGLQDLVEKPFKLREGILSEQRHTRFPAYIFVSCTGNTAFKLFDSLQENKIVDEISVLFGDIDIVIRVYGTQKEIQALVTTDLYQFDTHTINNSRTYFSMEGKNWVRYPISKHPNYKAPSDRWK